MACKKLFNQFYKNSLLFYKNYFFYLDTDLDI